MERLEAELEQETARLLSVAGENKKLANLAHNRWLRLCMEEEGAIQSWAMIEVLAKALEHADTRYEGIVRDVGAIGFKLGNERNELFQARKELEFANIEIARKASVIKAYEAAWSKGQNEPYINGGCAR